MTKNEKEIFEAALTASALRTTTDIFPDILPPVCGSILSKGWIFIGHYGDFGRVELACSSIHSHGIGQQDKADSQGSLALFSTKELALKALRRAVEKECAYRLRRIDKMLENEV
jgi:hypothetical protein